MPESKQLGQLPSLLPFTAARPVLSHVVEGACVGTAATAATAATTTGARG